MLIAELMPEREESLTGYFAQTYAFGRRQELTFSVSSRRPDKCCRSGVVGRRRRRVNGGRRLSGLDETLAEAVHELTIGRRQAVEQAVDRFDDDAPLRETGDGAECRQARFHFDRHTDTKLRIIFDLLAFPSSRWWTARAAYLFQSFVVFVSHS